MLHNTTRSAGGLLLLLACMRSVVSADPVNFESQITPLFAAHCQRCHGAEEQSSNLRTDQRASLLAGGESGEPSIVPGDVSASQLLTRVVSNDESLRMPPEGNRLTSAQIELLTRWIREGAQWPGQMSEQTTTSTAQQWPALTKPKLPQLSDRHPVDRFIQLKLASQGLAFSPVADRRSLVRRVTLDLTGLPPTPAAVAKFVDDVRPTPIAYESVVNRLLGSPAYGERWAQHWLDVIRWAETVGFETNLERTRAWPYRDWLIGALNADKAYDQFLLEQMAGDLVGQDAALGFLVAGPANLPGQIGRDEEAMRQARQDELDEVIRTVSQGVLGITVGCARCHNHKFDEIRQSDYYAMQAVFAGLNYGHRRLRGPQNDEWSKQIPDTEQLVTDLEQEIEGIRQDLKLRPAVENVDVEHFASVLATAVRMEIRATANGGAASLYEFEVWSSNPPASQPVNVALSDHGGVPSASSFALANQTRHYDNLVDGSVDQRQAFPWSAAKPGPAWIQVDLRKPVQIERVKWHRGSTVPVDYTIQILTPTNDTWETVASSHDRIPRVDDTRSTETIALEAVAESDRVALLTRIRQLRESRVELSRLQDGPQVYAASFQSEPPVTWLLRRGDPMQRVREVDAGVPVTLATSQEKQLPQTEADRRLAFIQDTCRPDHPLTARVIANRLWQHHFGTGFVSTPSDFGRMGQPATHPQLLNWLAAELVENDWSIKHLQRLIVTSHTYRQGSRPVKGAEKIDQDARWLWRFPPRRMEAEAIRDSILFVSGNLNRTMGGRGFDFFNQRGGLSDYLPKETFEPSGWRRMVYAHKIRMQAVDVFGAFDCPDAGQMKPRRTESITPVQSLGLFNSPFVIRQATDFAARICREVGTDVNRQIEYAFQLTVARAPSLQERQQLAALAREHGLSLVGRVLFNSSEFLSIQ